MTRIVRALASLTGLWPDDPDGDASWPPPIGACVRGRRGAEGVVLARYRSPELGEYAIVRETTATGASYGPLTQADWTRRGYRVVR